MITTTEIIKSILNEQIKANKAYSLKADKIIKNKAYTDGQKGERLASLTIKDIREAANNCILIFKLIEIMGGNDELSKAIYEIYKAPHQLNEQHKAFVLLEDLIELKANNL